MNDTEIRLHCIEAAEGDLNRAKQIYAWVTNRDEPVVGGIVTKYPVPGSTPDSPWTGAPRVGLNVGIPIGSASATTAG